MYRIYISHGVETFAGSTQDEHHQACLAAIRKAYPRLVFDADINYGLLGVRVHRDVYELDSPAMCELRAFCRGFLAALEGKNIVDS